MDLLLSRLRELTAEGLKSLDLFVGWMARHIQSLQAHAHIIDKWVGVDDSTLSCEREWALWELEGWVSSISNLPMPQPYMPGRAPYAVQSPAPQVRRTPIMLSLGTIGCTVPDTGRLLALAVSTESPLARGGPPLRRVEVRRTARPAGVRLISNRWTQRSTGPMIPALIGGV